ncbi:hypothetical protein H109_01560 [Trichophyton interdigitale MR816]|uniref:Uncharacterized protein n=1 Tax=Trichophyton interdigitale (strain MR816) TaxID=1215338 RepID=A0A059JG65_TRIIM|nr:hypothetical protein H109_01560 [Trichophyton interdigitale MR816]
MPGDCVAREESDAVCDAWAKQLFVREAQLVIGKFPCRQTLQRSAHRPLQCTGLEGSISPSLMGWRWRYCHVTLPQAWSGGSAVLLQLSGCPRIEPLVQRDQDDFTWDVVSHPLSINMNELLRVSTTKEDAA